jgi:Plasmid pRiA4b ORF-3-like protein
MPKNFFNSYRTPISTSAGSSYPGTTRTRLPNWPHEASQVNTASDSVNEIATVRIELRHADRLIWRQVEVPTSITLQVLHDIIQAVMGWFDYHLWEFTVGKQKYGLATDEDWGTAHV